MNHKNDKNKKQMEMESIKNNKKSRTYRFVEFEASGALKSNSACRKTLYAKFELRSCRERRVLATLHKKLKNKALANPKGFKSHFDVAKLPKLQCKKVAMSSGNHKIAKIKGSYVRQKP